MSYEAYWIPPGLLTAFFHETEIILAGSIEEVLRNDNTRMVPKHFGGVAVHPECMPPQTAPQPQADQAALVSTDETPEASSPPFTSFPRYAPGERGPDFDGGG